VTATITDINGVVSATLYYGYAWPFNALSVAGSGPGGAGNGTWTFPIPAQGQGHWNQALLFFLRADDGVGDPAFNSNNDNLYAIEVTWPGDWDDDGDVDLADYAALPACLTGPEVGPPDAGCDVFDFDSDLDVDLADFADFQAAFGS